MNLMQFFNIWLAYVAKRKSQSGESMKCSKQYVFLSITLSNSDVIVGGAMQNCKTNYIYALNQHPDFA